MTWEPYALIGINTVLCIAGWGIRSSLRKHDLEREKRDKMISDLSTALATHSNQVQVNFAKIEVHMKHAADDALKVWGELGKLKDAQVEVTGEIRVLQEKTDKIEQEQLTQRVRVHDLSNMMQGKMKHA